MNYGEWIQVGAVLVAIGASLVALYISDRDRENSRRIAADDRRSTLEQAKLMFELEALSRLLENLNRGGSSDPLERKRMGAEALTLIGVIGPELLPGLWTARVGPEDKLHAVLADDESPPWKKTAIEAQLAVNTVLDRLKIEMNRT